MFADSHQGSLLRKSWAPIAPAKDRGLCWAHTEVPSALPQRVVPGMWVPVSLYFGAWMQREFALGRSQTRVNQEEVLVHWLNSRLLDCWMIGSSMINTGGAVVLRRSAIGQRCSL